MKSSLDRMIEEIEDVQGSGTELVSLYVRPDKSLGSVVEKIREEKVQAQNIKSKETRSNVVSALS